VTKIPTSATSKIAMVVIIAILISISFVAGYDYSLSAEPGYTITKQLFDYSEAILFVHYNCTETLQTAVNSTIFIIPNSLGHESITETTTVISETYSTITLVQSVSEVYFTGIASETCVPTS
jgi:hypothetical protein